MSSYASGSAYAGSTRYSLPQGSRKGWIQLADGSKLWVELTKFVYDMVSEIPAGGEACVDVAVHAAYSQGCNWVRIW